MKIKNSLFLLLGLSAVTWLLIAFISKKDLSIAIDFFKILPTVVTIDTIAVTIFFKFVWKCKIFKKWLVKIPNLQCTWTGNIHSNWINPKTQKKVQPIPVMLTIKQNFFHISCVVHTLEMKSTSISAGIEIDEDNQIKKLSYIYTSNPRVSVKDRSPMHEGAMIFDIIEKPQRKLSGKYWTERNTTGEVSLSYYNKGLLEEIPEQLKNHPVTEDDNKR